MNRRRLWICLAGGAMAAVICLSGGKIVFGFYTDITWPVIAGTVANRLLLGFVIGISAWRIDHLLHGLLLGLLVSLSVSIGLLPDHIYHLFIYTGAGMVYGVLIEWLATDVLKAPATGSA